jgi:membrane protease YdiL (CAAX protease family)
VRKWVRTLSPAAEFAIVILGAFGFFILTSYVGHFRPSSVSKITNAHLQFLILFELIVGAALAAFLLARGWSLKRLGLRPTLLETGIGLLLMAVTYVAWIAIWILVASFSPPTGEAARNITFAAPGIGLWTAAAASLVNGMFEEIFVCGYVIAALKDRTMAWTTINISVGIRLLYHLYQGPYVMIFVVLAGVTLGYWYAHRGRLWPPIVAHGVMDFVALYEFVGG